MFITVLLLYVCRYTLNTTFWKGVTRKNRTNLLYSEVFCLIFTYAIKKKYLSGKALYAVGTAYRTHLFYIFALCNLSITYKSQKFKTNNLKTKHGCKTLKIQVIIYETEVMLADKYILRRRVCFCVCKYLFIKNRKKVRPIHDIFVESLRICVTSWMCNVIFFKKFSSP